eukprot:2283982-Pleurochrysis_carterae.AAC.1
MSLTNAPAPRSSAVRALAPTGDDAPAAACDTHARTRMTALPGKHAHAPHADAHARTHARTQAKRQRIPLRARAKAQGPAVISR